MLICKLVPLAQPTKQAANLLDIALWLLFIAKQQPPKGQLNCIFFLFLREISEREHMYVWESNSQWNCFSASQNVNEPAP